MADIISLQDGERPSQSQPTQTSPVIDWVPCIWSSSFSVVMAFYSWLCHSFFIWSFAFLYKDVLSVFLRFYGWMMIELVIKFQVYGLLLLLLWWFLSLGSVIGFLLIFCFFIHDIHGYMLLLAFWLLWMDEW